MVVLLVVALATGTFAWYQNQPNVTANNANIGAVLSDSASIEIGWGANPTYGSSTTFGSTTLRPAIPVTLPTLGATGAGAISFEEAIISIGAGGPYVSSVGTNNLAWTQQNESAEPLLKLHNVDPTTTVYVFPTVTIVDPNEGEDDLSPLVRVALFLETAESAGTYKFMGVWGANSIYAFDISVDDTPAEIAAAANEILAYDDATTPMSKFSSTTESTQYVTVIGDATHLVKVWAWLEGTELDVTNMTYTAAQFNVNFRATQTAP
jgi:hypothetical protein